MGLNVRRGAVKKEKKKRSNKERKKRSNKQVAVAAHSWGYQACMGSTKHVLESCRTLMFRKQNPYEPLALACTRRVVSAKPLCPDSAAGAGAGARRRAFLPGRQLAQSLSRKTSSTFRSRLWALSLSVKLVPDGSYGMEMSHT